MTREEAKHSFDIHLPWPRLYLSSMSCFLLWKTVSFRATTFYQRRGREPLSGAWLLRQGNNKHVMTRIYYLAAAKVKGIKRKICHFPEI